MSYLTGSTTTIVGQLNELLLGGYEDYEHIKHEIAIKGYTPELEMQLQEMMYSWYLNVRRILETTKNKGHIFQFIQPQKDSFQPLSLEQYYSGEQFTESRFKACLSELPNIIEVIKNEGLNETIPNAAISYDKSNRSLKIGNKLVNLNQANDQAELCEVFFSDPSKISESRYYDEILESWEPNTDKTKFFDENGKITKKYKHKIYNAAASINKKIAKATDNSINDFLTYNMKTVSVTEKYRQLIKT